MCVYSYIYICIHIIYVSNAGVNPTLACHKTFDCEKEEMTQTSATFHYPKMVIYPLVTWFL